MARFSEKSLEKLKTCDLRLQRIAHLAIRVMDFTVLEGERGKEEQDHDFETGKSKKKWPDSNHNVTDEEKAAGKLARAMDVAPYPIDWKDRERFCLLAGIMKGIAVSLGYTIRWGGDWNQNNRTKDENFSDLPHIEIVGSET